MLKNIIKSEVEKSIEKTLKKNELNLGESYEINISVETPKKSEFGDFAVNISKLSKYAKKPPGEIANAIKNNIELSDCEVNIVGGFINFKLGKSYLKNILNEIYNEKENYIKNNQGDGKKVLLEYVSANPTGPFHIGHGRWAAFGSALANILKVSNYKVHQEFYINDAGNQINNLGKSLYIRLMQAMEENIDFPYDDESAIKNYYTGEYLIETAKNFFQERTEVANEIKKEGLTKQNLEILSNYAKKSMFDLQHETLNNFKTYFDEYFSECSLYKSNEVENCVNYLKDKNLIYEEEGALWFKTTQFGDEQNRVIKKQDGSNTYLTSDIAYHINKLKRGYDILINIWGADHHGYIPRIKAAIEAFGYNPNSLEVILGQLVNLIIDGEQARMGKRSKMITLSDLINEVGVDATRFWMLLRSCDTTLDFDVNLAKSANDDNPVFYVQYAHARACSILRHANGNYEYKNSVQTFSNEELENIFSDISKYNLDNLFEDELGYESIKRLVLKLEEIKSVIYNCAKNRCVYLLCKYLLELGQVFHQFYNTNRVITDDREYTTLRLILVKAFIIIMNLGLNIIGISAPDKM
ncbi:MAG: arginine--tRNA ligase [Candidatus Melainabacteria bacterium LEY3_CP_29_8]|nr:MAG: arginine--tRNA ligase [Candidatus Melainabacteria bacterium LEY3_CP_29_8]